MKIFKSINSFVTKATIVLDQAAKDIDRETEAMLERNEIRHNKVLEEHKKLREQLVIDGGYESEEAMEIAIKERIDYLRGRN